MRHRGKAAEVLSRFAVNITGVLPKPATDKDGEFVELNSEFRRAIWTAEFENDPVIEGAEPPEGAEADG